MVSKHLQKYPVTNNFHQILHDLTREVIRDQPDDIIKYGVEYFESIQEGKPFNFQSKSNIAKGQAIEKKHQLPNQKITQNKARKLLICPIYDKSLKVSPQHLEQLSVRQPSVDYFNELFQKVEQDIDQFESSKSETSNAFFLPQQISQSKQGCQKLGEGNQNISQYKRDIGQDLIKTITVGRQSKMQGEEEEINLQVLQKSNKDGGEQENLPTITGYRMITNGKYEIQFQLLLFYQYFNKFIFDDKIINSKEQVN